MNSVKLINHLAGLTKLENNYFIMRHALAVSNIEDIIVGDPAHGTTAYGLTEFGIQQAHQAASAFKRSSPTDSAQLKIISSDFLRARETAQICRNIFGVTEELEYSTLIRERDFGDINLKSVAESRVVEKWDLQDMYTAQQNVEPLAALLERMTRQITDLEQRFKGRTIFIVSHGDPLIVLDTASKGLSVPHFRDNEHFANAQIKELRVSKIILDENCKIKN